MHDLEIKSTAQTLAYNFYLKLKKDKEFKPWTEEQTKYFTQWFHIYLNEANGIIETHRYPEDFKSKMEQEIRISGE